MVDDIGFQIGPKDVRFWTEASRRNYGDKVDRLRQCMLEAIHDKPDLQPANAKIRVYSTRGYEDVPGVRVDPWNDPNDVHRKRDRLVFSEDVEFEVRRELIEGIHELQHLSKDKPGQSLRYWSGGPSKRDVWGPCRRWWAEIL